MEIIFSIAGILIDLRQCWVGGKKLGFNNFFD
jgi:hypothetical protein